MSVCDDLRSQLYELSQETPTLSRLEFEFLTAKRELLRVRLGLLEAKIAEFNVPDEKIRVPKAPIDCGRCYIIVRLSQQVFLLKAHCC